MNQSWKCAGYRTLQTLFCLALLGCSGNLNEGGDGTSFLVLISKHSNGTQADENSINSVTSDNGRYIAFQSASTNLVDLTVSGLIQQIYFHDTFLGTTRLVSVNTSGQFPSADSTSPAISGNGRYVAFTSAATDLISPTVTGTGTQIYVRDMWTETTTLVSMKYGGLSHEGGDDTCYGASLSADGLKIAFASKAIDLVDQSIITDGNEGGSFTFDDIFVRNYSTGKMEVVSLSVGGTQGGGTTGDAGGDGLTPPQISANGQFVSFTSKAQDLVSNWNGAGPWETHLFRRDLVNETMILVDKVPNSGSPSQNTPGDDFSSNSSISGDGRYIAFESIAGNLVTGVPELGGGDLDIFLRDCNGDKITHLSQAPDGTDGDNPSSNPSISSDGMIVVFTSSASNLIPGTLDENNLTTPTGDIFLYNRKKKSLTLLTTSIDGQANGASDRATISGDSITVVYESSATNLVQNQGDLNGSSDIFRWGP